MWSLTGTARRVFGVLNAGDDLPLAIPGRRCKVSTVFVSAE